MTNKALTVDITIDTDIKDPNGENESIRREEKGSYVQRGGLHLLKYDEEMEDVGTVKNTVIITDDKITLKREGVVKMHQVFRIGQRTETVYRHPYGHFRMETNTNRMEYMKGTENRSGKIRLEYEVALNDDEPREHVLQIDFQEEDA
ncbi:uncharacterized beta-barrel protein YwiB (DUF1934 family) [Alkalibacillus flavidus]|uniref:Uncharacterized beta-barrel protein YwiB (DUF1934 family) n=1 Tax=Alkalibacillus flavidus TaxID=546021 RepID=A0ABV2KYI8_9BACI